jgi:hypothetical protein
VTKTIADGGIPRRGRWRGGSQRHPREVTAMTACSDAMIRWDVAATGRESVQRRENHQQHTCRRRHVGSRRRGPKAAMLWPEGATQRQPDARTVVGTCSGTYLAETCVKSVDQTDGGAVRAKSLTTAYRSEPVASLSVKSLAMTAKTDRRWRPHRHGARVMHRGVPRTTHTMLPRGWSSRLARRRYRRDDHGSRPRQAQQPAEGPQQPARADRSSDSASASTAITGVWVAAGARSTPRLEERRLVTAAVGDSIRSKIGKPKRKHLSSDRREKKYRAADRPIGG